MPSSSQSGSGYTIYYIYFLTQRRKDAKLIIKTIYYSRNTITNQLSFKINYIIPHQQHYLQFHSHPFLSAFAPLRDTSFFDLLRRNACNHTIIGHIPIDKTKSADYRIFTNRYARHNDAVASDPTILFEHHRPLFIVNRRNRIYGQCEPIWTKSSMVTPNFALM